MDRFEREERGVLKPLARQSNRGGGQVHGLADAASRQVRQIDTFLCTEDRGRSVPNSVFNASNRAWLASRFGLRFVDVVQLAERV